MTKQDIIDTAFKVWGRTKYTTTSLSRISDELDVTKTALYRYIPNKESLLKEMFIASADFFTATCDEIAAAAPFADRKAALTQFFSSFFSRYLHSPEHFFFLVIHANGTNEEHNRYFLAGIEKLEGTIDSETERKPPGFINYLIRTAFFWMIKITGLSADYEPQSGADSVDPAVQLCLKGIRSGHTESVPAIDRLIRLCEVDPKELPENNRFFTAIARTVSRYGLQNASMEKIARELNMNKSSLYFHFANKEKMMKTMFREELSTMQAIYKRHAEDFGDPWGKILCHAFTLTSYLLSKPEILTTFGWIRVQITFMKTGTIDPNKVDKGSLYLLAPLKTGPFDLYGLTPEEFIFFINFHITQTIMYSFHNGMKKPEIYEAVYVLCSTLHSGLGGDK